MAKGKINLQANDGAVIGLVVPDGLTSGERQISLGSNLSNFASYHLLQGNLAVDNTVITQGFNTTLYTGNGTAQSINTGIDMDTQWGNDASERFGGLVWGKSRSAATGHGLFDSIRGANMRLDTSATDGQASIAGVTAFNNNGFSLSSWIGLNTNLATYVSWNFQTTHRVTGTTNHGKPYTCHYNPFTGFTMIQYAGSGIAGHEIPHHLRRKLDFAVIKNTSLVIDWIALNVASKTYAPLNTSASFLAYNGTSTENIISLESTSNTNGSTNQHIMYGWANSYFDKANKLIGNYEIGVYQGTGASDNKVLTRGKPAWLLAKRIDSTGYWAILDNQRGNGNLSLYANVSNAEANDGSDCTFESNSFTLTNTGNDINASGGQYLYMVVYDTNSNGGGTYYPLASDTANVQINNALIPIAKGIDSNGAKNTILSKNETFSGVTYTQGKNYPYYDALGNRGVSVHKPRYLESELVRTYAGESPDYFNVKENKWYSTNSGSELLGTTGWTATGGTLTTVGGYNQFVDTTLTGYVSKTISTVVGKSYTIVFKTFGTREANIKINNVIYQWVNGTFIGTKTINFVANSVSTDIVINDGSSTSYTIQFSASMFETAITPTTEITNGRNYLNHIVYADNDGGVLYVEELPKIEYKDIVKANEFKGKNACTAWANVSSSVILLDNYNFSAVTFKPGNAYKLYFKEPMDNTNYVVVGAQNDAYTDTSNGGGFAIFNKTLTSFEYICPSNTYNTNNHIIVFGGKN